MQRYLQAAAVNYIHDTIPKGVGMLVARLELQFADVCLCDMGCIPFLILLGIKDPLIIRLVMHHPCGI